jgi:hypothetical protein
LLEIPEKQTIKLKKIIYKVINYKRFKGARMVVYYNVVGVFGVKYSFDELKNFRCHEDTQKLAKIIGSDYLPNVWNESGFVCASSFDGEKEKTYLVGYQLKSSICSSDMRKILEREDDIKTQIREFSEKYNVINKENEINIVYMPNIY